MKERALQTSITTLLMLVSLLASAKDEAKGSVQTRQVYKSISVDGVVSFSDSPDVDTTALEVSIYQPSATEVTRQQQRLLCDLAVAEWLAEMRRMDEINRAAIKLSEAEATRAQQRMEPTNWRVEPRYVAFHPSLRQHSSARHRHSHASGRHANATGQPQFPGHADLSLPERQEVITRSPRRTGHVRFKM